MTADSGVWDTVDKICLTAIFILFVVALFLKVYEKNE